MLPALVLSSICSNSHLDSRDAIKVELKTALKVMRAPGASILVVKKGKVVFEDGLGFASLEQQSVMRSDSVHDLASISKMFTAAAILRLDQEGSLRLSDTIDKYFSVPEAWQKISILNLLQHTSGLPDYLEPLHDFTREYSREDMLGVMRGQPLRFAPGTRFEYSNSGYLLLGFILNDIVEGGLEGCMKEQFIKPLSLNHTALNTPQRIFRNRAEGYDPDGSELMRKNYTSRTLAETADRHLVSNVHDVRKWTEALFDGTLLDAEHLALMLKPSAPSEQAGRPYGCGIVVKPMPDGSRQYMHHGGWAGTSTVVAFNPTHQYFYAIFCNLGRVDLAPLEKVIQNHFDPANRGFASTEAR